MTSKNKEKFYLIEKNACPEVFRKVIEVKEGIRKKTYPSINQAVKEVGISRSAYYKYHKSVYTYRGSDFDSVDIFNIISEVDLVSPLDVLFVFDENSAKIISVQQSPVMKGMSTIQIICRNLLKTKAERIIRGLHKINGIIQVNHNAIRG
ncbi:MAG TPA: hypothetical protein GXZ43_05095 [Clostridiaceae bacterium]|nr:hypothetical protein [Clostridiaceae bacterium]